MNTFETKFFTKTIATEDYIAGFRDVDKFMGY
jgi:hypothetical protein